MKKTEFDKQIEELFDSLSGEEVKKYCIDVIDYLKLKQGKIGPDEYPHYSLCKNIAVNAFTNKKLSLKQFKCLNSFTKIYDISDIKFKTWE